ncbi:hypothetical protein AB205_0046480, partial [Aquarana catesbeiana]
KFVRLPRGPTLHFRVTQIQKGSGLLVLFFVFFKMICKFLCFYSSVKVVPVGMSKGVKKLLQEKFPNMSRWEDISELLVKNRSMAGMKRKKGEDDEDSEVEDPGLSGEQDPANLSEDDDAEYYRQVVGEEPDQDLFDL